MTASAPPSRNKVRIGIISLTIVLAGLAFFLGNIYRINSPSGIAYDLESRRGSALVTGELANVLQVDKEYASSLRGFWLQTTTKVSQASGVPVEAVRRLVPIERFDRRLAMLKINDRLEEEGRLDMTPAQEEKVLKLDQDRYEGILRIKSERIVALSKATGMEPEAVAGVMLARGEIEAR